MLVGVVPTAFVVVFKIKNVTTVKITTSLPPPTVTVQREHLA